VVDHAFGGVLDRDHAEVSPAPLDLVEDFLDGGQRDVLGRRAKLLDAGEVRERGGGTQISHFHGPFQRQGAGHDLAVHGAQGLAGEGAWVVLADPIQDLGFAGRGVEVGVRILRFLQHSDRDDMAGALVQQTDDLVIDLVDFLAIALDRLGIFHQIFRLNEKGHYTGR